MNILRKLFGTKEVKNTGLQPKPTPSNFNSGFGQVAAENTRQGDGTILTDLIAKGVYAREAGSEKIGYFDPSIAPFRNFPNGKTGLLQGQTADQLIQMISATDGVFGEMFGQSNDIAVELAIKLQLTSTKEVLEAFVQIVKRELIAQFLMVTTTMPFFMTYCVGQQVMVIAEVDHELKLNALANLLLKDPDFASVRSVSQFEAKAESLMVTRKEEVEEKKELAIRLQKSRTT